MGLIMRMPNIYRAKEIKNWDTDTELPSGEWVPARPHPYSDRTFMWRFHLAWLVFTGKCDALGWQDNKAS